MKKPTRLPLNARSYPQWIKNSDIDKQDLPRTIQPSVYVLALEDGFWYVGLATHGAEIRIYEQCANMGALWTRRHKPLYVEEIYYPGNTKLEKELTLYYAHKFGAANVRGAPYCTNPPPGPMQPVPRQPSSLHQTSPSAPLAQEAAPDTAPVHGCLQRTVSAAPAPMNRDDGPARE